MNTFVSKSIGDDADLRSLVVEMNKISQEFGTQAPEYVHSEYQCFIAARVMHECKSRLAFSLGSG